MREKKVLAPKQILNNNREKGTKITVPPIFKAEKFRKQLQDPLDPFTVEFMLRFATYLWNCTYAVKQL